jgi:2-polyprenyl-3-methyl-5-hydroxy-6-metoxy-1,4-benzoquinol methylase
MTTLDRTAVDAQSLAVRMFTAALGAAELFTTYLGVRLGLYQTLADAGPMTAAQLTASGQITARYAREWLEQQAAAGILEVDDPRKLPESRLYALRSGYAEALTDADSPFFIASMALLPVGAIAHVLPRLVDAYQTGHGVCYAEYGEDFHAGQGLLNRAVFLHQLPRWIARGLPALHAALSAGGRVADVGCGAGWSSIALARAYPALRVDGFDLHDASVAQARQHAAEAGVADRVTFTVGSASERAGQDYTLACIFDALHDMARPQDVLRACVNLLRPGGSMLLLEPKAAETFTAPADETERFLYAVSLLHCLPVGLSDQPSAATGTVLRPSVVRAHATAAGFGRVTVVPIDHRFHRLYHLER